MMNPTEMLLALAAINDTAQPGNEGRKREAASYVASISPKLIKFDSVALGELFIAASFLECACRALIEQHWLQTRHRFENEKHFTEYLGFAFNGQFKHFQFLRETLGQGGKPQLEHVALRANALVEQIVRLSKDFALETYRSFLKSAAKEMQALVNRESLLLMRKDEAARTHQERVAVLAAELKRPLTWEESRTEAKDVFLDNVLDRAFDAMDEILDLDYERDRGMARDLVSPERLYEGAGAGVQSTYSTVLTALRELQPAEGSRFIDLGSGYGRVGLLIGLLRPDMDVIGYEYVGHRVDIAQAAATRAGLSDRVQFFTQDLAAPDFQIPLADTYYIYDSFSRETYHYVLGQIRQIAEHRAITVVTKGNAQTWVREAIQAHGWATPVSCDSGVITIFRSSSEIRN